MKEIAEGGTSAAKLCLNTAVLWVKDPLDTQCPTSLDFALPLPNTFTFEEKTYVSEYLLLHIYPTIFYSIRCPYEQPLPPSFDVKLSGLPGFIATIDVSFSAIESTSVVFSYIIAHSTR